MGKTRGGGGTVYFVGTVQGREGIKGLQDADRVGKNEPRSTVTKKRTFFNWGRQPKKNRHTKRLEVSHLDQTERMEIDAFWGTAGLWTP